MDNLTAINLDELKFEQHDRLEKIYGRLLPKSSTAFSDELFGSGSGGGRLETNDILAAVGWVERKEPFGGALLRATYLGDDSEAIWLVYELLGKVYGEAGQEDTDLFILASVMVQEHVGSYSMENCKTCKGKGFKLDGTELVKCCSCDGVGVKRAEVRPHTRYRRLKSAGSGYSRRYYENAVLPLYGDSMSIIAGYQTVAGQMLIESIKKPA